MVSVGRIWRAYVPESRLVGGHLGGEAGRQRFARPFDGSPLDRVYRLLASASLCRSSGVPSFLPPSRDRGSYFFGLQSIFPRPAERCTPSLDKIERQQQRTENIQRREQRAWGRKYGSVAIHVSTNPFLPCTTIKGPLSPVAARPDVDGHGPLEDASVF